MMNPVLAVLFAAALMSGGLAWWQTTRLEAAQSALALTQAQLSACGGRLQNVIEDVRSDNAIDNLTDDDLRNVPDEWLLAPPAHP